MVEQIQVFSHDLHEHDYYLEGFKLINSMSHLACETKFWVLGHAQCLVYEPSVFVCTTIYFYYSFTMGCADGSVPVGGWGIFCQCLGMVPIQYRKKFG